MECPELFVQGSLADAHILENKREILSYALLVEPIFEEENIKGENTGYSNKA